MPFGQGDHALVVARFADTTSARAIYDDLLTSEVDGALHIDGVLVVKADDSGRIHVEKELAGVITPGTSGILALVTATDAPAVEAKMPTAQEVKTVPVDEETAGAIKEAAAEAEAVTPSGS